MHIIITILLWASLVMAEPPVSDGYPAARSPPHHHNDDHLRPDQKSLSQDYVPPSPSANSAGYSSFNSRTALNSRRYSPPTTRVSFTQRFSSAVSRNSKKAAALKSLSKEYLAPNARVISQEYGAADARSLSQEYGVPSSSARTLSTDYIVPDVSSQSLEFHVPVVAPQTKQKSEYRSSNIRKSQSLRPSKVLHSLPSIRPKIDSLVQTSFSPKSNDLTAEYGQKLAFTSRSAPSSSYGVPSSQSLATSYSVPSAKDLDSYSQEHNSVSEAYGTPSEQDSSDTPALSTKGLSQEYRAPSNQANLKTDAIVTSYTPTRTAPSSSYLPSARDSLPSQQYGAPNIDHGYEDTRANARALEELQNQVPANYDFSYQIEDQENGGDFGHSESRFEDRASGSYFVVLPDGTKQTVEYEADEGGFKPRISVEAVGGYDDNAADVTRTAPGPY